MKKESGEMSQKDIEETDVQIPANLNNKRQETK